MRKLFLLQFALALSYLTNAQIGVGPIEMVRDYAGTFSAEQYEKLKASKTVFIYRKTDNVAELESAIKKIWTFTEISFEPFSKLNSLDMENTSILSIVGFHTKADVNAVNADIIHVYLNLWMEEVNAKGKKKKLSFCRIELNPSLKDYNQIITTRKYDALDYLYTEAELNNWQTGLLKNYLQTVNNSLTQKSERWIFENTIDDTEIKKLSSSTLFVPDYVLNAFKEFPGDKIETLNMEKLFKAYPYNYQSISPNELSSTILKSAEPFYYLNYVKSSSDKYINIINSQTGKIVYSNYKANSFYFKDSDLKNITKAVK